MKPVRTLLLVILSLLLLGGCVKVDLDLTVASDDTISGTMILAVDKSIPSSEQVQQQLEAGLPPGVTSEPYEDEQYRGITATYDKVPIADFAGQGPEGAMQASTLRREGDFYIYGQPDPAPPAPVPGLENAMYRVKLTFPGEVVETNGVADGNSVEWTDPGITPYAKAEAAPDLLVPILIGSLAALVLVAGVLAAVLLIRRRRAAAATVAATPDQGGYDPTAFTGVFDGGQEFTGRSGPAGPPSGPPAAGGSYGPTGAPPPPAPGDPDPWSAEGARRAEASDETIWRRPDGS